MTEEPTLSLAKHDGLSCTYRLNSPWYLVVDAEREINIEIVRNSLASYNASWCGKKS